jgi:hypothetical protein
MLYAIKSSEIEKLLLNTGKNKNLKLNWTMFYISNKTDSNIQCSYFLCKFLKNKTDLNDKADFLITSYLEKYNDLVEAFKTGDNNFVDIIEKIEKSAENITETYFMQFNFPETHTPIIKDTKIEQLNLENLFTKYYDYNRIIDIDFESTKLKKYALYEIDTFISTICEKYKK